MLLILCVLMVGCGGPALAPRAATPSEGETVPTSELPTAAPTPAGIAEAPCSRGRLTVGDLPEMDQAWRDGLAEATTKATTWQQDAVLSTLKVACALFEPGFRWQATFYSRNAQAFLSSDTGEVTPSGVASDDVPSVDANQLSFGLLHRALTKSGYDDATEISASTGVDVRTNTERSPFGPPEAPRGNILYHVAIERLGEVKDVFVDGRDGTVYRYGV